MLKYVIHTLFAVILYSLIACSEHSTPTETATPVTFMSVDSIPFTPGPSLWDSTIAGLSVNSYESFNYGYYNILEGYAYFLDTLGDDANFVDVGNIFVGGAQISATYFPDSTFEYRIHDAEPYIPVLRKPLFGQQTRWQIPANTHGIPTLDTMLYTPRYLNVRCTGTIPGSDYKITSTSTITLQWDADPLSNDTVVVEFVYDTRDPINADGNYPPKRLHYKAFVPDQGQCVIPASVIGLVPFDQVFNIRLERRLVSFYSANGKYISLRRKNYSSHDFLIVN